MASEPRARSDSATWVKLESVYLDNGPDGTAGDSVGVPTRWQWPNPMEGMTTDKMATVKVALQAACLWRENQQAADWVGKPIAEALGLDLTVKADRAKVSGMVKQWIAAKMVAVVTGKDDKRRERPFVEVGQWQRSTEAPTTSPMANAAPPPPATP